LNRTAASRLLEAAVFLFGKKILPASAGILQNLLHPSGKDAIMVQTPCHDRVEELRAAPEMQTGPGRFFSSRPVLAAVWI
jgi:hypothetical protein